MGKKAIRKSKGDNRKKPADKNEMANQPLGKSRKVFFNLVFILLIILPFPLVETGLWLADYGIDTRVFVQPLYDNNHYVMNVNFANKYFPHKIFTQSAPIRNMLIPDRMAARKPPRVLRGFVIGESTAQGFPYKVNQSFGKITEAALNTAAKYDQVEIMNLGVSAISSYCIKDIALKLLAYQPDFLVVYAGHNEYYGTISATTGGNYFTKNLYLRLKESRFFQLLFNLNVGFSPSRGTTVMAEQFNRQKIPLNPKLDREVAADFIKNIDGIVRTYTRRNIPVIIMEPVCNLYDMPPFSGENDARFKNFIAAYATVVKRNDHRELKRFYQARLQQKRLNRNANVRYLDAITQRLLTGKPGWNRFKLAKDLDTTPFRAKEALLKGLRNYCVAYSRVHPNLFFIPLSSLMAETHDPDIFGNKVFIDQLHFTQFGQRLISRVLTERIAAIFHFNQAEKRRITKFYRDDPQIDRTIHFLPAYRIEAHLGVQSLIENAPFTQMMLPYRRQEVDGYTLAREESGLVQMIAGSAARKVDPIDIADYYFKQKNINLGKEYLDSYQWNYPGSYQPYLAQAWFGMTYAHDLQGTLHDLETAYLLSEKMKTIYDETAQYLKKQDRADLMGEFQKKYGDPE